MPSRRNRPRAAAYRNYVTNSAAHTNYSVNSYPEQFDDWQQFDAVYDDQQQYDDSLQYGNVDAYPQRQPPCQAYDASSYSRGYQEPVPPTPPPRKAFLLTPAPYAGAFNPLTPEEIAEFVGCPTSSSGNEGLKASSSKPIEPYATLGFASVEDLCKAFTAMKKKHEILQKKVVTLQDREKDLIARLAKRRQANEQLETQLKEINDKQSSFIPTIPEMTADFWRVSVSEASTDTLDLHPVKTKATRTSRTPSPCAVNDVTRTPFQIPELRSLKFDRDPRESLLCEALSVGLYPSRYMSAVDSDFSQREEGRHRRAVGSSRSRCGDRQKTYRRRQQWHEDARRDRRINPTNSFRYPQSSNFSKQQVRSQACCSCGRKQSTPIRIPTNRHHPIYYPFPRNCQTFADTRYPLSSPFYANREDAILL